MIETRDIDDALKILEQLASPFVPDAVSLFEEKRRNCVTMGGIWWELVYCILAGSQIPVETVRRALGALKHRAECGPVADPVRVCLDKGFVETSLRESGYRFHHTKAEVVQRAATFTLERYDGDLRRYVGRDDSVNVLERELVENIRGVGKKIANHWLRNAGADTCTVDLHLKRLFVELELINCIPKNDTPAPVFAEVVEYIRLLACRMRLPLAETQYALWLGARERYSHHNMVKSLFEPVR